IKQTRNNLGDLDKKISSWQNMATRRMENMDKQIAENHKEMKQATAQAVALAGLFQPYNVGKFNITAAVGGYSDQQAIAIGSGYRFSSNIAAKAGVAFSGGDPSWNVGMNFEF
ncbi:immunoglobulin-binding protein, partial [Salmonella enterica subsp. enterica serovar Poona]|nr:immunoglobulin-binding protein [Salmonella enterica subsp. enterica serovar Poona]EBW2518871.1 immunoglobulin-binding protein [Salmonella enterica subsp. enterica serovar Poona]ECG3130677.1 immunoglobulin-binding protein [Salmonella enterica subsp. enterica serovar Poona]